MKNNLAFFTAGEFAKIHSINKRTLHYYDSVGIFSPKFKGENGYRYYTYEQSMELENILSLREIGMSIEELQRYINSPNKNDFRNIAREKVNEIDKTITRLKKLKEILKEKSNMLDLCDEIYDRKIEVVTLNDEYLLMTKLPLSLDDSFGLVNNSKIIMEHLKSSCEFNSYKRSCGSYISIEKINSKNFNEYDGIFTKVDKSKKELFIKPSGKYIRGFSIGDWSKIPLVYEKIVTFARENNLTLSGYAFESGLNEFAISDGDEYITQIEILCNS
ncbi:MerR family transcriptional regulator [uncultured Clostridium sp.]|uniref:MerR family transcriptional regulator n=1 Tax=uncultured Clostridium sp. TaxID=59620 RepID=UPI00272D8097|nr:MerR family transcriptional regulator [uncultured Clostridium sp.]